jgi:hypothetical protein
MAGPFPGGTVGVLLGVIVRLGFGVIAAGFRFG